VPGAAAVAVPISQWLSSISPSLGVYAGAFEAYGYNDTSILQDATVADLEEAMAEIKVKKPHRASVLRLFGTWIAAK
jgi:hypothetical protein